VALVQFSGDQLKAINIIDILLLLLFPCDAMQSAVMPQHVVRPSV